MTNLPFFFFFLSKNRSHAPILLTAIGYMVSRALRNSPLTDLQMVKEKKKKNQNQNKLHVTSGFENFH